MPNRMNGQFTMRVLAVFEKDSWLPYSWPREGHSCKDCAHCMCTFTATTEFEKGRFLDSYIRIGCSMNLRPVCNVMSDSWLALDLPLGRPLPEMIATGFRNRLAILGKDKKRERGPSDTHSQRCAYPWASASIHSLLEPAAEWAKDGHHRCKRKSWEVVMFSLLRMSLHVQHYGLNGACWNTASSTAENSLNYSGIEHLLARL